MRYIKSLDQINENSEYKVVYSGNNNVKHKYPYIWVSKNVEHASGYGSVTSYKMSNNLNILDVDVEYQEFDEFVCEYEGVEYDEDEFYDNDEYKFEPPIKFINFLATKGYDGFEHETPSGDNIIIFDSIKLVQI